MILLIIDLIYCTLPGEQTSKSTDKKGTSRKETDCKNHKSQRRACHTLIKNKATCLLMGRKDNKQHLLFHTLNLTNTTRVPLLLDSLPTHAWLFQITWGSISSPWFESQVVAHWSSLPLVAHLLRWQLQWAMFAQLPLVSFPCAQPCSITCTRLHQGGVNPPRMSINSARVSKFAPPRAHERATSSDCLR